MPFFKSIALNPNSVAYFWKIDEDFNSLFHSVSLKDTSLTRLEKMKSESHQKGFLAVRKLLQHIGYDDFDLVYDEFGKPHLKDLKNISISHSNGFSSIAISNQNIGIDLEILKEKTLKIAFRYMDVTHLEKLSVHQQLIKATIIWGIKESIFKLKNEVGISFIDHIFENNFNIEDKKTNAQLHFNNQIENYEIVFDSIEDYIFVAAFEKNNEKHLF